MRALTAIALLAAARVAAGSNDTPTPTPTPAASPTPAISTPAPTPPPSGPKLTLSDAYKLALKGSEAVRLAENGIVDAEVSRRSAGWDTIGPLLVLSGADTQETAELGQNDIHNQRTAHAQLDQVLFRKGLRKDIAAANLAIDAAKLEADRQRQVLMIQCVSTFIDVLAARQKIVIAQGALTRAQAQVDAAQARVKGGSALRTSLLLAQIDARKALIVLGDARRLQREAEISFERLFGMAAPDGLVLPAPPPAPPLQIALDRAVVARSDFRAAQTRSKQTAAALSGLKGRVIWPTVKAIGAADYFDPVVPGFEKTELKAIALISFPLYQGGAEFTAIRHQRVAMDDASMEERRLRRDITEQVKSAELELEAAQNTFTLTQDQIRDARENYDLVQNQFKLGAATPLEVANAQANLSEAETQNLVAGYQQQLALYELLFATGQLQL